MSSVSRKIGNYSICFEQYRTNEKYFDKALFLEILEFIKNLKGVDKIIKIKKYSKAVSIDNMTIDDDTVKIVFKNCKYNHSPEYMSSEDGSERKSDKKLSEGDKEVTHMLGVLSEYEMKLVLEERRSGVSIGVIIKFLNKHLRNYLKENDLKINFSITYAIIPIGNFEDNLKKMNRVKIAEVFTYKRILGSEELNLLKREDPAMRDEITITMKSKTTRSLGRDNLKSIYNSITGQGEEVSRIRIFGESETGFDTVIDSRFTKKTDFVDVVLKENGVVNTNSIFKEMKDYLEV